LKNAMRIVVRGMVVDKAVGDRDEVLLSTQLGALS
jgi:hypothetical protein